MKQKEAENAAMMEEMAAMKAKMKELEQKHAKEAKKRQCVDAARPPLTGELRPFRILWHHSDIAIGTW